MVKRPESLRNRHAWVQVPISQEKKKVEYTLSFLPPYQQQRSPVDHGAIRVLCSTSCHILYPHMLPRLGKGKRKGKCPRKEEAFMARQLTTGACLRRARKETTQLNCLHTWLFLCPRAPTQRQSRLSLAHILWCTGKLHKLTLQPTPF